MPSSYDGDIKLKVSLNATDTRTAANNLRKSFEDIFKSVAGKDVSVAFKRLQKSMSDTMYKSDQLNKKITELGEKNIPTKEFTELQKGCEKAKQSLQNLVVEHARLQERLDEGGMGRKVAKRVQAQFDAVQQKIEETRNVVEGFNYEMEEMKEQGTAYISGSTTDAYKNMVAQSATLNNQMRIQLAQANAEMEKMGDNTKKTNAQVQKFASTITQWASLTMANVKKITSQFKRLLTTILSVGAAITKSGLSKLGEIFHIGSKSSKGFEFNLKKSITTILKYAFGIRSLYFLFRKLRSAVKEAFDAMAQQIPEVNRDLSRIVSAWQDFKNSLGTMFQPLLAAITPVLTQIINLMTKATIKVGEFIAALTGQEYTYQATKANIDYAKSLDKTTKSKKKKNDEDKKELGFYDKLNVIQKDKKKDDDDDDTSGIDPSKGLYKKVPISKGVSDFMKRLKDTWNKNGDFTWLGELIAEKIKNALKKIPWDYIKHVAGKLGKAFAEVLNGIFKDMELARVIGNTIAQAFNTALNFVYEFLKRFDGHQFGRWLGELISSALRNIEWAKVKATAKLLGQRIAEFINGFFETDVLWQVGNAIGNIGRAIVDFFYELTNPKTGINFVQIGEKLRDGLKVAFKRMLDVDETGKSGFKKLGESISRIIVGIFTAINKIIGDPELRAQFAQAITEFLDGFDWAAIKSAVLTFAKNMILLLGAAIKGMFASGEFRKALGDIAPVVITAFGAIFTVSALKAVASIAARELIKQLTRSLATQLVSSGAVSGVTGAFSGLTASITGAFSTMAGGVSGALGTIATALGTTVAAILGAVAAVGIAVVVWVKNWDEIKEAAGLFVERTVEHWESLKGWFAENMPYLSELCGMIGEKIKEVFIVTGEWVLQTIDKMKAGLAKFKEWAHNFGEGFKQGAKATFDTIKTHVTAIFTNAVENVKRVVHNGAEVLKSTVEGFSRAMLGGIKGNLNEIYQGFVDVFTSIMAFFGDMIRDAFNWGKNLVTNIANGVKSGWHLLSDALNGNKSTTTTRRVMITDPTAGAGNYMGGLASGAVIPPNKEFLATLGDQKSGVNIETPLNTMLEAFKGALADMGGNSGNTQPIVLQLDGRTVAQVVWDEQNKRYRQTGQYSPRMA